MSELPIAATLLLLAAIACSTAGGVAGALTVWLFNGGRVRAMCSEAFAHAVERVEACERTVTALRTDHSAFLEGAEAVLQSVETKRRRMAASASVERQALEAQEPAEPPRPMTREEELAAARERMAQRGGAHLAAVGR